MWTKIVIYSAFLILGTLHLSQAFALNHKLLECEYYNKSSCAHGDCKQTQKITCEDLEPEKPSHCFVLWSTNNVTDKMEVTLKGCFSNNVACNQSECIDYSSVRNKNLNFCCCKTDMCNTDHKWIPTSTEAIDIATTPPKEEESVLLPIICVVIVTVIFCALVIGFYCYRQKKHAMFNEVPQIEPEVTGSSSCLALRKIQLHEEKARGRFGTVWRATMKTDEVAVKIFPMQDKQSWLAEQDIYKLPRMKHLNILEFIGAEKRFDSLKNEFWLISTYHKHGSLCDYLKAHTVTWPELCKIAESMARGLMHLHEEIPAIKSDGLKPAIAHRDFKSKNVLLKNDLTACIADFGLALVFTPGRPCGEDHGQVGTRRYMAPEVLEGAITFTRDSFLRIDVYACGLVLWELVSRCTGHNGTAKEFRLPFENEIGAHPTLEEMQENVVMKKIRPKIEDQWRKHTGLSAICDTMEECWDHDAEARLSSSCVMERVAQHTRYPAQHLLIETNTSIKDHGDNSM